MANSKVSSGEGFGRSDRKRFTITTGHNGTDVFRLDLGRPYAYLVIRIEDCSGFSSSASLSARVANDDSPAQAMCDLYELNDPNTIWSKSVPVTAVTCSFVLTHAFGARYIQFITSNNCEGTVNIDVYGYDPSVINTPGGI